MKMPDPKEEWRCKFHCGVNACIKTSTCQTSSIGLRSFVYGCLGVCRVNHRHSPHMAFLPSQTPSISRLQSIYISFLYISCVAAVVIQDGSELNTELANCLPACPNIDAWDTSRVKTLSSCRLFPFFTLLFTVVMPIIWDSCCAYAGFTHTSISANAPSLYLSMYVFIHPSIHPSIFLSLVMLLHTSI